MDGRVAGSNFLWENNVIAGVGPITIDPAVQNVALGRRLMEDVIRRAQLRNFAGVRLVQAAYHNRSLSLYTKLGFDTREPLSTMRPFSRWRTARRRMYGSATSATVIANAVDAGDRKIQPQVEKMLGDESPEVRAEALQGIADRELAGIHETENISRVSDVDRFAVATKEPIGA